MIPQSQYPSAVMERVSLARCILSLSGFERFALHIGTSLLSTVKDADIPTLGFSFEVPDMASVPISDIVTSFTRAGFACYYVGESPAVDPSLIRLNFEILFM